MLVAVLCFFKQKTAYEMRISDWSSDVCSSDLDAHRCSPASAPQTRHRPSHVSASDSHCREPRSNAADTLRCKRSPGAMPRRAGCTGWRRRSRCRPAALQAACDAVATTGRSRSEEHTSELQSLMRISYAVFRLNKKKNNTI